jgi:restriction endonuclease Mrr
MGGMVAHEATQGIMVTTSSFSGPARELAASQDIRLIDGVELSGLLGRSLA